MPSCATKDVLWGGTHFAGIVSSPHSAYTLVKGIAQWICCRESELSTALDVSDQE